jgi:hypothetical protein
LAYITISTGRENNFELLEILKEQSLMQKAFLKIVLAALLKWDITFLNTFMALLIFDGLEGVALLFNHKRITFQDSRLGLIIVFGGLESNASLFFF